MSKNNERSDTEPPPEKSSDTEVLRALVLAMVADPHTQGEDLLEIIEDMDREDLITTAEEDLEDEDEGGDDESGDGEPS